MSYPYRNPRLQMDLPQPEPDSRLILNHETGRYLRLGLREFDWLHRLDGQTHASDVAAAFGLEGALAQELLSRMGAAKLICFSDEPVRVQPAQQSEGTSLRTRRIEWTQFGQLRVHFGRPAALLERLLPLTRTLFSKPFVMAIVCLSLLALALGLAQSADFGRAVREFQWGIWQTIAIVALVFATTVVHELGHAVACHYCGAPVRSLGIMLYYLQPAAYADVTDSWQLKNRWQRVAIASAGVYMQAAIASVSMIVWTLVRMAGRRADLLVMFMALNVAIMLFNVFPFVKLDGYWIVSNMIGLANLRDRAMEWVRASLRSAISRRPVEASKLRYNAVLAMAPLDRALLAAFGISSMVFGVSMWFGGLGFLFRVTRWLGMRPTTSIFAVAGTIVLFVAAYVASLLIAARRARRVPPAAAQRRPAPTAIVTHTIDPHRPIRLNPHVAALETAGGNVTFAWSTPDALTVSVPVTFFDLLPRLREGSATLHGLRQSDMWSAPIEQAVQRLWHERHLRYTSDWEVREENLRYSRQLGWFSMNAAARGKETEVLERLRSSCVTILGVGGLGTHVAWNLAACGVGELHLVDGDTIELTNLNRQLFYTPADIGLRKVDVTAERLLAFNPQLKVRTTHKYLLTLDDFFEASKGSTFVVRAVDSPNESIAWVNEACVTLGIPHIGAGFFPQGTVVGPTVIPGSSCAACNAPAEQPRFDRGTGGTLAPLVFATAGLLANEVIAHLGQLGTVRTIGRALMINAPTLGFGYTEVPLNEDCPVCGREQRRVSA